MKKYLFIPIVILAFFCFAPQSKADYTYYRSITVTSTATVASGTNSNFPMLVSSTLTSWESSSTGGSARIQNLCTAPNGGNEPCDLIFVTSTPAASGANWNCGTALNFETEQYVSSTGALIDWVNVPSLSAGTVIYVCYGNAAVVTDQSHPSSTWNSNYALVWHMNQSPAGGAPQMLDSTANGNNGTEADSGTNNLTSVAGAIGNAVEFPNTNPHAYFNFASNPSFNDASYTFYAVVKPDQTANLGAVFGNGGTLPGFYQWNDTHFNFYLDGGTSLENTSAVSTGNWYWIAAERAHTGSTRTKAIYFNGKQENFASSSGDYNDVWQHIGTDQGLSQGFRGSIDEVEISNTALTSSWILTEYNNQKSPDAAQSSTTGFYSVGAETAGSGGAPAVPGNPILILKNALWKLSGALLKLL